MKGLIFKTIVTVVLLVNPSLGQEIDFRNLPPDSREQFKKLVYESLMGNPEIIENALITLEKKRAFAQRKKQALKVRKNWKRLYDDANYPVIGNPQAPYSVVLFLDHQCGFCHKMLKDLTLYVSTHPDVRIILRDYPFLSEISTKLAELSLFAHMKGKTADFVKDVLTLTDQADATHVMDLAKKLGLSTQLNNDEQDQVAVSLKETKEIANALDINSTPTFVVGPYIYENYRNLESFDKLITKRLRNYKKKRQAQKKVVTEVLSGAPQTESTHSIGDQ